MKLSEMMDGLAATIVRDGDVQGFGLLTFKANFTLRYYTDPRFAGQLAALSGSQSLITTSELADTIPQSFALAIGSDPKELYLLAYLRHGRELLEPSSFPTIIAPTARIHPRAVVSGRSVQIGAGVVIDANAVIEEFVEIEDGVSIGPGSTIGGSGFEVGTVQGRQVMLPHYGGVVIRRGATLLANTSVARGIYGVDTEIGPDSMLDNLVHVAHNVRIGARCQLMACAMIAGSCVLEDDVRIGPNATISNGLRIGRGARVTLGSVVTRDVPEDGHVTGNFALPHRHFLDLLRETRRT